MASSLNKLSQALFASYEKELAPSKDSKISVNPVVAELASWYEKFRTAMDYRDDEMILRSAIERILRRRILLGGNGESISLPLIRELVWARYFPDASVPESIIKKVADTIDLFFQLEVEVNRKHRINKGILNEWIFQLLSCEIEDILKPSHQKNLMCNFIFQLFKDRIIIEDDSEQSRDIQLFIAVRRAYGNDDLPFLRFHLFKQYFDKLTQNNLSQISDEFLNAFKQFNSQLDYPLRDRIYSYIKKQTVPFMILDDVLKQNKGRILTLASNEDTLNMAILDACNKRYAGVVSKVRRAVVRSVIFIFFTKAIFALSVEGTFESFFYGKIQWSSIALNTLIPPIMMVGVGLLIQTPTRENSLRIMRKINTILFDYPPNLEGPLILKKRAKGVDPILFSFFIIFWVATFVLSFGAIIFILTKLHINPISQGIFVFFLAIVSFISYRINRTANMYVLKEHKESISTLAFDFFFMPFIYAGRRLTVAISQVNIFLFIFDFIIETPFKGIFAFFEQWFLFLRAQREKLD